MPKEKNLKLIPLRKFVKEGLYSQAYLSVLAKRGKLKTKKIGRNYFTTTKWFKEYMGMHAREEKVLVGKRAIKDNSVSEITYKNDENPALSSDGFFSAKIFRYVIQASVVFAVLLSVIILADMILGSFGDNEKGRVLGAEEEISFEAQKIRN